MVGWGGELAWGILEVRVTEGGKGRQCATQVQQHGTKSPGRVGVSGMVAGRQEGVQQGRQAGKGRQWQQVVGKARQGKAKIWWQAAWSTCKKLEV